MKRISVILSFGFLFLFAGFTFADGFIIIDRPQPFGGPFPLEVLYHRVNVTIEDQVALTSIEQSFYNPTNVQLEGYYIFPVPTDVVIKDFAMDINGVMMQAELLDAQKARALFEEIVRQVRDPALLEYDGRNIYKLRIFPIEPRSEKKIKISYREVLHKDNHTVEYLYPLNTEKFSAKPLNEVEVKVNIKSAAPVQSVYSPTHTVTSTRVSEKEMNVVYSDKSVKPDIDFKIYINLDPSEIGFSVLSYNDTAQDGFFFLTLTPDISSQQVVNNKNITFVLDVSGSMAGKKLEQAKLALTYCIENLLPTDHFEIIKFSTEATALFGTLTTADKSSVKKAVDFIDKLKPVGGTNIDEALQLALKSKGSAISPSMVLFITDGIPTIGEIDDLKLLDIVSKANSQNARIFTFGIGTDINTHLLDKISEQSRATRSYITTEEQIELKIAALYDKIQSPVLSDITLETSGSVKLAEMYPRTLTDIFKGSSMIVLGRYTGSGSSTITLSGTLNGQKKQFQYKADFVSDSKANDFIPPLWAARRIGFLLDEIRLRGQNPELVQEVTQLARLYGIVTPYTSYLIMEDERIRVANRELDDDLQTLGRIGQTNAPTVEKYRTEYEDMKDKTGERSVQVSEEFQALNYAENTTQTRQGQERLDINDGSGNVTNLMQNVRYVQGRAIYQNGTDWVDSYLQSNKAKKTVQIKFASDEYFDLLRNNKGANEFLALGQNVRFLMNGTLYEITAQ